MQLIRGLHNIKQEHRGCVATIGNFDGVHIGHKTIIAALHQKAQQLKEKTCVITFEPLPREYFDTAQAPARLSSLREKLFLLAGCQVDQLLCLPFGKRLSSIHANEFIQRVLVQGLGIHYLIVGDDFRFGCGRAGDFPQLMARGKQCGFEVCDTQAVVMGSERISSTRIREALASNQLEQANQLLGHPLTMIGRVVKGKQLGRKLGFPTANIRIGSRKVAIKGVFSVRVYVKGCCYLGVANMGCKPTVSAKEPLLEVHLLDFDENVYGHNIRVEFIKKLRDERKFDSLAALSDAIAIDIKHTQKLSEVMLANRV
ncbi:MAG: bifunctional riboflavin kinase/FAD synthetase [Endozoicomonas sp. (ex Botrylloides leachii)]|nr:bifunctional riboflavin kinase/FAD synthetase [Endozoicomonas sp. (ex Botrylloides leachii)]